MRDVGDELALALEHLLGLGARLVQRAQHALQRRASSATSSSASGRGTSSEGSRVRSISRATLVSSAIGRMARAGHEQAGQQGQGAAGEHAEREQQAHARDRGLTEDSGRAYWMIALPARQQRGRAATPRGSRARSRSPPGTPRFGARVVWHSTWPLERMTRMTAFSAPA